MISDEKKTRSQATHSSDCPLCGSIRRVWPNENCYYYSDPQVGQLAYGLATLPNLEACRQAAGMSVEELADKAYVMSETIYALEAGRLARRKTMLKLTTALGVGIAQLTGVDAPWML